MNFIEILILSFIEGLTEFLPVSSTGHLILASKWMNLPDSDFTKAFQVIIQFGAILAVLIYFRKKFFQSIDFYKKILIGSAPVLLVGYLLKNKIDLLLESTSVVAASLIIGGLLFIISDFFIKEDISKNDISIIDSFKIGCIQCIALIPGVSRSGATILAGQFLKYPKKICTEFSFFLAVPTLTAATLYKTYKIRHIIDQNMSVQLLLGIFLSFVFALVAIQLFLKLVNKFGFKWFGYYRIILGIIVLIFIK